MFFDASTLTLFVGAVLALTFTPGPDMLMCITAGTRAGPRGAIAAGLGLWVGLTAHTCAAAFGLAALLAASPHAFEVIRWAGAGYLVWIAIQALRPPSPLTSCEPAPPGPARSHLARFFRQALVTNLLNPKIILFFLAFLPQFADPSRGAVWAQILTLGLIFAFIGIGINIAIGSAGGLMAQKLSANQGAARWLNRFAALVFVGLAARLALAEH